ncbi:hypothetical protein DFH08DRAFT_822105 [Mycena albidolilacea]|uniref:Uncharacterized protein n=1 Tax=Mycena albidolilacea TaxID=1033008 RepID=A0AAD6Z8I0_9AGAR|nr:hypothetical protein DFH08DRAFT_822105 [Mycena albidolilacea]
MPGMGLVIANVEAACDSDVPPPCPEKIKLWMLSNMAAIGKDNILRGFIPGLLDMEKGQAVLVQLKEEELYPHLQELKPEHIVLDGDHGESDATACKKLVMIEARRGVRVSQNVPGTLRQVMSWIWTVPGALEKEEECLHDSIRMEWARARACKTQWSEEVMLLREEMHCVLQYLSWEVADWHDRLADYFQLKWNTPALKTAQEFAAVDGLDLAGLFE